MTVEEALGYFHIIYTSRAQKDSQAAEPYGIAITALNKQIGAKPYKIGDKWETQILCPQCNYRFYSVINGEMIAGRQSLYCPCCGQRIDWSEENE